MNKIWKYFTIGLKSFIGNLVASLLLLLIIIPILIVSGIFAVEDGNISVWVVIIYLIFIPLSILVTGFILNKLWKWK